MRNVLDNGGDSRRILATPQRRLLLELLRQTPGHIDARDLYHLANARGWRVSLATVYRTLDLFRRLGLVEERRLDRTRCYYEIRPESDHYHMICQGCGKVFDFQSPLVAQLVGEVRENLGFEVRKAVLYLEGMCPECTRDRDNRCLGECMEDRRSREIGRSDGDSRSWATGATQESKHRPQRGLS